MNRKYEFTDETITFSGHILHRIRSVRNFGNVAAGELGGFIEKEENLSHDGNAWVSGEAKVFGEALVSMEAYVYGHAVVRDNVAVHGNARISGYAQISGYAHIYGYAKICDYALVSNNATISGMACCITDINSDLEESIRVQTGLIPVNGEVIAYKMVRKDLTSFYDPDFKYEVGKIAEAKDPDESDESCAPGLHFSNANYSDCVEDVRHSTFLIARIKLDDIITVQEGKIRCRKAEIIGKYDIKM